MRSKHPGETAIIDFVAIEDLLKTENGLVVRFNQVYCKSCKVDETMIGFVIL